MKSDTIRRDLIEIQRLLKSAQGKIDRPAQTEAWNDIDRALARLSY